MIALCRSFSLFVPESDLKGKLLVTDLARFAQWHQFSPADDANDRPFIYELIFIRVIDLNADNILREQIVKEDPEWLRKKSEKERYLRTRVVIKIYEKFKVEVVEPAAGVSITITDLSDLD